MRKAIEKAIYYQNLSIDFTVHFTYTDEKSFQSIVQNLNKNFDVINYFEPKDSFIYTVFKELGYMYKELFLDQVECVYLINRKNVVIKIAKKIDDLKEVNEGKVAILNVDSILSEYYKQYPYFKQALSVFLGGFVGSLTYIYICSQIMKE